MGKVITFDDRARRSVLDGMEELEKAVVSTLGPKGRMCILDNGSIHPVITKDGVSVSRFIEFSNPYKNIGAHLIQEVARKVENETGDGTTTSTLLAGEMCKEGNRLINQGFDAVDIKKGFEKACHDMISMLEEKKQELHGEEDIFHVACISANNDEEIGSVIREAYSSLGEGGRVSAIPAHNRKGVTSITYSSGFEIPRGIFSSSLINTDNESCFFEEPSFFVYDDDIIDIKDVEAVFLMAMRAQKSLVVVCLGMGDRFESSYIQAVQGGKIVNTAMVKAFGADKSIQRENLRDIAVHVGAAVYGGGGKSMDLFTLDDLGSAESITITKNLTSIVGGRGKEEDVQKYVSSLKDMMIRGYGESDEDALSPHEVDLLKERIAKLTGGMAVIHYGGYTDVEVKEKKDRYEDALHAVSSAIEGGILSGGGCGLLHVMNEVEKRHIPLENSVQETGYQRFLKIMEQPARYIITSTGMDAGYYVEMIKNSPNFNMGFNAKTESLSENMYEDGIIDPVMVLENALAYSTSMAGAFITTNCVVTSEWGNVSVEANDKIVDERRDFSYGS